jgi:hypothetical protein
LVTKAKIESEKRLAELENNLHKDFLNRKVVVEQIHD